ncbi:MAG: metal ABC transporter permease [Candidatus Caldarchaeum sp.]|uniref:Metal ABC transporter permease n=1 Tax=Caldiarchaeum subterraneum TaxID=311458 RepID=A0A7J3VUA1_CALS0
MIEALQQPFIQRALAAAVIAGFLLPLMGSYLVPKKLALLGDASSHVAFAALAITTLLGLSNSLIPYLAPALAVYIILTMMNRFKISGDQALAVFLAMGAATASIALSLGARVNLNAILFGSVLLVSDEDVLAGGVVAAVVGPFVALNFGKTVIYTMSEELAKIRGVNVKFYQVFLAVAAGLAIVSGIKVAGVLLVTALVAIPTAAASLVAGSFKKSVILSVSMGIVSTLTGVVLSYYTGITPGAASVLVLLSALMASAVMWRLRLRI